MKNEIDAIKFNEQIQQAQSSIEEGNGAFKCGDFLWAKQCYTKAIQMNCKEIQVNTKKHI